MAYFLTGGTGFIGRHLLRELAARGEPIYLLVRPGSRERFERLARDIPAGCAVAIEGDLSSPALGVSPSDLERLRGKVTHFFHLGALYDLNAATADLEAANVDGTRHALQLASEVRAGCFHLVSSIAVAGSYPGRFTEEMFEEAQGLDHPYFRTKHESEALVRAQQSVPWRVYRPAMVVGHSGSGVMDKVDGPYYVFRLIRALRSLLPPWVPVIGFEGGHINLVPVDFVAAALAHLAHVPGHDGRCFHLTDPRDRRVGEVLNVFAKAAHAPTMTLRLEPALLQFLHTVGAAATAGLQPLARIADRAILARLGLPKAILGLLNHPTSFDATRAQELLEKAGIRLPVLEDYAWRLWDYWERHLDPEAPVAACLPRLVQGKTVLITGGSSGIGRATALRLAEAGATVLIVARDADKLARVRAEIEARGGKACVYACDITDESACRETLTRVLAEHRSIDILINNAGRSIRRAIENTYDRFHDYERLMRLNYFAAVRVTLGVLPAMVANGGGHVISISSIGALSNAARFAGYNASKAALDAFSRCAAAEYRERHVHFTVINMPLVRTPMVAPTRAYESFQLMRPEQAAELVCEAIVRQPERLATRLGFLAQLVEAFAPGLNTEIMSESFRMFPESEAAGGRPEVADSSSQEMHRLASLLRGIHW